MTINATLCYVIKDDHVLMLHRIKKQNDIHEGKWNGLGGKFDEGETPEDCVKREVEEESGLNITEPHLKGIITFPNFDGTNDWFVFVFVANQFSGTLISSPEGKLEWIKQDDVLNLNLWEGDYIFLPWIWKNRFFSAKFVYQEKKLKNWTVKFY